VLGDKYDDGNGNDSNNGNKNLRTLIEQLYAYSNFLIALSPQ
jgi:hypothetical protein